jgi:hypothetical protein
MTGKILFLDFDGVLNSTRWSGLRPIRGLLPPELATQALEEERLDPMCVDRLQRLVRETGVHIVVTSTWRQKMSVSEMISMFALYGFIDAPIIGVTPDLRASANRTRGIEVAEWLEANQLTSIPYVCLDDDADFIGLPLVQTDPDLGLQEADVRACQDILNGTALEAAQAQNEASTHDSRPSGENRLFVRPGMVKSAIVRRWPSGK